MKPVHIEKLPIHDDMPAGVKSIRRQAPSYVKSVIDDAGALPSIDSIEELRPEHIDALGGGADAATYLVKSDHTQVIIKFSPDGLEAEAEALRAWKQRHVRVPAVLAQGVVPTTKKSKKPISYLVQEALLDRHGRVVETCASYLIHSPQKARAVGRLLGIELTKMHQAVAERSFGDYGDSVGNKSPFQSWGSYVVGYLDVHTKLVRDLGVGEDQIQMVRSYIEDYNFPPRGRYLHGDFSVRNAAVKSHEPLKINIFDPNPIIGDPTWDIAVMANNLEFQKLRLKHDDKEADLFKRDQQLMIGLKQGYKRRIDPISLEISQLMQAILQASFQASKKDRDPARLKARQEFVVDMFGRLVKRAESA